MINMELLNTRKVLKASAPTSQILFKLLTFSFLAHRIHTSKGIKTLPSN